MKEARFANKMWKYNGGKVPANSPRGIMLGYNDMAGAEDMER